MKVVHNLANFGLINKKMLSANLDHNPHLWAKFGKDPICSFWEKLAERFLARFCKVIVLVYMMTGFGFWVLIFNKKWHFWLKWRNWVKNFVEKAYLACCYVTLIKKKKKKKKKQMVRLRPKRVNFGPFLPKFIIFWGYCRHYGFEVVNIIL